MSIINFLKNRVENLPESVGRRLAFMPYTLRLGCAYTRASHAIQVNNRSAPSEGDAQRLAALRDLLQYAVDHIVFYRDFYRDKGLTPADIQTWEDWRRVPVITKADLQSVPLSARRSPGLKGMKINTGGTSGQPLVFYLDKQAFAREWAHMHFLWKAHGYRPQHLKLTFRGKHFESQQVLRYNAVHNEYIVNANTPMNIVVETLRDLPQSRVIRWLHGYPSLIAEFAHAFSANPSLKLAEFRSRLFGVLLGSEYPAPVYRTVIENTFSTNVVSWYGHSEMAILARETSRSVYESLPTYGYAEALRIEQSSEYRLVCTSFHNRVHPLIRYDTGDVVEPVSHLGGSLAFRITEGRIGDFLHDRQGRRHSLTAIIFGRHHAAFELLKHLQVREDAPGRVTLVVTPRNPTIDKTILWQGFDLDDLDIDWQIEIVDTPLRTPAGKLQLKIGNLNNCTRAISYPSSTVPPL